MNKVCEKCDLGLKREDCSDIEFQECISEKLKDHFKILDIPSLIALLNQYKWEEENGLGYHNKKIILLEEIIKRKKLLEFLKS